MLDLEKIRVTKNLKKFKKIQKIKRGKINVENCLITENFLFRKILQQGSLVLLCWWGYAGYARPMSMHSPPGAWLIYVLSLFHNSIYVYSLPLSQWYITHSEIYSFQYKILFIQILSARWMTSLKLDRICDIKKCAWVWGFARFCGLWEVGWFWWL